MPSLNDAPQILRADDMASNDTALNIKKRVALITGAATGIGRATALAFAREGVSLMLGDINETDGEKTAREIERLGGAVSFHKTDVTDPDASAVLVKRTVETFGQMDIAFNNAGITGASAKVAHYPLDIWNTVLSVNLTGIFHAMRAELPVMAARGSGVIINTASVIGLRGTAGGSAYSASKHGIVGLTRSAALEYGRSGIRINALCPGYVETHLVTGPAAGIPANVTDRKIQRTALKRLGTPEEIADMVVWIADPRASFLTGTEIIVDGGYLTS